MEIPTDYSSLDLRLCEYEDPESYPYRVGQALFADTDFVYDWQVQGARDGSHDVHPVDQPASQLGRAQVVRRWLYTDLVQTRKLAVRCVSPAGVTFVSNTPNPSPGKFDSYIIVDGRAPKELPWSCFGMTGPHNAANSPNFDVDLYYIYFTDPNYKIVGSVNHRELNQRGAHYAWNKDSGRMEHIAFPKGSGAK